MKQEEGSAEGWKLLMATRQQTCLRLIAALCVCEIMFGGHSTVVKNKASYMEILSCLNILLYMLNKYISLSYQLSYGTHSILNYFT